MSFWTAKRVLVTGGAGFIGSQLSRELVERGCDVSIIDNLERGKLEFLDSLKGKVKFFRKDLRDIETCVEGTRQVDIVFHLAAKVGGLGYYLARPGEVITETIRMDSNILEAVVQNNVPYLFYASSAHVYPKHMQSSLDAKPIREEDAIPAAPELSYGWAKLLGEQQIEYLIREGKPLRAAVGRLIGIYGRNQDIELDTGSVIPVFARRAVEFPRNSPFVVRSTGQEMRTYCFIDDAIDAVLRMVEKLPKASIVGPLNIGSEERITIREIAEKIVKISGKAIPITVTPSFDTVIWSQLCDCSKATIALDGWKASTPIQTGLRTVYDDVERRLRSSHGH